MIKAIPGGSSYRDTLKTQPRAIASGMRGISLIETLLALVIAGILMGIAVPAYDAYKKKIERAEVMADILEISDAIDTFFYDNHAYPDSLEEVRKDYMTDVWGNPYQYLRIAGGGESGKGKLRKDKNLVPINTDYDLYSSGPDGRSVGPLTAKHSRDDIVRANNGSFIGVATDY
jgi:general secretion pathway protein G